MNFLLTAVNAKYIHSNPAVYSLKSYVGEELKPHIQIAEYTINHHLQDILEDIYRRRPDVIGFSCYIWNWSLIQEIIVELHKLIPHLPIWLGGPEVSFDAGEILEAYPMVTGVMVGEGEATFRELVQYYADCLEYPGISFRHIRGIVLPEGFTGEREPADLSSLPFLYEDLKPFENRIIYYESSRGCPYQCSYCLSSVDQRVRFRNSRKVVQELQFFLDRRVPQVKFVDRTFNCNHEHAMEIWRYIKENDNNVTNFHFEIAADILREDEILLLREMRPGLVQLEIGVQSANPVTLKEIQRRMDLDKLQKIVEALKVGNNVHLHLDLIAGLPYEDYESFGQSFDRVYEMRPEQLQMGFLKVLKGSHMHRCAGEYGISYLSKPPYEVLYTKWLPFDRVTKLKKVEAMVELYYNSNQFTYTLPVLEKAFTTPFEMFEKMAEFYEEKGYFASAPARMYRYEVLLQFAVRYDPGREAFYKEVLTYDLYLREKLKSRPAFAPETEEDRAEIRGFYREKGLNRKDIHLELFSYPVWKIGEDEEKGRWFVLFDYTKRSPLTHEADVTIYNKEEQRG